MTRKARPTWRNLAVDNTDRYGVKGIRFFGGFDDQWEELHDFESDSRFYDIFCKAGCDTRGRSLIHKWEGKVLIEKFDAYYIYIFGNNTRVNILISKTV